jgi:membrane protease YdiL (CAAX protease family)
MTSGGRRSRWTTFSRVVLLMVGCAIILMAANPFTPHLAEQWPTAIVGTVTGFATLGLSLLFLRWDGLRLADVGAAPRRRSLVRMALGFLVGLLLVAMQMGLVTLEGHLRWVRSSGVGVAPSLSALAAYLALACREELAFHGYPLRRMEQDFGLWGGQIFVATIFAFEHVAGGYSWRNAILGAFAGSLLFGMAALATRGLAVPIGLHAAWNFGQWILGQKAVSGLWMPVVAGGYRARFDRNEMLAYLAVVGPATVAFWWMKRRRQKTAAR